MNGYIVNNLARDLGRVKNRTWSLIFAIAMDSFSG